ncbi:MAG: hypothetical protein ACYC5H_13725 [Methylovirgula sp.]
MTTALVAFTKEDMIDNLILGGAAPHMDKTIKPDINLFT